MVKTRQKNDEEIAMIEEAREDIWKTAEAHSNVHHHHHRRQKFL